MLHRNKVLESEDALSKSKDRLRRLQSSHGDRLAMFGPQMKTLVDAIKSNSSRFAQFPIGPLGSMLELRDYTWATAVEQVIKKNMMYSFIADNHRDADTLRGIIRSKYNRAGPRPEVVVSAFQSTVYDVRRNVSVCKSGCDKCMAMHVYVHACVLVVCVSMDVYVLCACACMCMCTCHECPCMCACMCHVHVHACVHVPHAAPPM